MTTHVPERRRASDLNVRGRALALDDGEIDVFQNEAGEWEEQPMPPVTLWMTKLGPLDMDSAMKEARRAQAVAAASAANPESPTWQAYRASIAELSRDVWVSLLVDHAMLDRRDVIAARLQAATDYDEEGEEKPNKWAKDGYLEGLFEAWNGGLKAEFAVDPDDPEAARVLGEIDAFNQEVEAEFDIEKEIQTLSFSAWPDEHLLDELTRVLLDGETQEVWLEEYKVQVVARAARDCEGPDPARPGKCMCRGSRRKHTELHFKEGVDEVRDMDPDVRQRLYDEWSAVMVNPREGKGSPATPASSTPSESPSKAEVSNSSSLEA